VLVAGDGSWISLRPECFEQARELTALLRDRIPPSLRVPPSRAESRVERALEQHVTRGERLYAEVFADWLDEDEEIGATAVVRGMDGNTIVMVTDQRLLMAATGTGYGGRCLRLSEITDVRWSRFLPFNVRFRAGGTDVRIDAMTVDGAHEIAVFLGAAGSGERRPQEVVVADARWMVGHRSWKRRLIGPFGEHLKVAMIGGGSMVMIVAGVVTGTLAAAAVGLLGLFHAGHFAYSNFSRHQKLPTFDVSGSDPRGGS
jgi:hypothetical protein